MTFQSHSSISIGKNHNQPKISLVSGIMLNSTTAPFNFFRLEIFLQTWNWIATAPFSGVFVQSHHHWSTGGPPAKNLAWTISVGKLGQELIKSLQAKKRLNKRQIRKQIYSIHRSKIICAFTISTSIRIYKKFTKDINKKKTKPKTLEMQNHFGAWMQSIDPHSDSFEKCNREGILNWKWRWIVFAIVQLNHLLSDCKKIQTLHIHALAYHISFRCTV